MNGLKFRIGGQDHVAVTFRQHKPGGTDSCLVHFSLRAKSLQATEEAWVRKSALELFVSQLQSVVESLAGVAELHRESGAPCLLFKARPRGHIQATVELSGHHVQQPDNLSWGVQAHFSFFPEGRLVFLGTGGLPVRKRYLKEHAA